MRSFEIVYDGKQEKILGSSEVDINTLTRTKEGWIQYKDKPGYTRILFESQILLVPKTL